LLSCLAVEQDKEIISRNFLTSCSTAQQLNNSTA